MKFIYWFCILTIILGVNSFDEAWSADLSASHLKASETLIDTLDQERFTMNLLLFSFPKQAHSIIKYLLDKETGLWDAMKKDVSIIYAEMFTEQELKQLTAFFKSGVGKKWIDSQEEFFRRGLLALRDKESYLRQVAVLGCVAAILVPNIEGYKKKAGITEEGIPPEIMILLEPLTQSVKKTCTCVIDEAAQKWGFENIEAKQNSPEFGAFMNHLLTSGKCPIPGK